MKNNNTDMVIVINHKDELKLAIEYILQEDLEFDLGDVDISPLRENKNIDENDESLKYKLKYDSSRHKLIISHLNQITILADFIVDRKEYINFGNIDITKLLR